MGSFTKKYFKLFIFISLLAGFAKINAQCNNAVSIRCVSVDAAGDVTLTWVLPPNLNSCGWDSLKVYASATHGSGYVPILPAITNTPQTFITIPESSLPASPNFQPIYFYVKTVNIGNLDYNSDTVSSIYVTLTNNIGTAQLYWNPLSAPLPQGSSTWYRIYREYNNVWSLVDSTKNMSYLDTITYCDSTLLNYQIQIADSNICISTSNIAANSSKFTCTISPPQVVMDTVSVTSGNSVDITWAKSSKPNVIGYIIYYKLPNGSFDSLTTVYGINTDSLMNYILGGNPSDTILTFGVAALDSCGHIGGISNPPNTLLLKVTPDACAQNNTLTWNAYEYLTDNGGYGVGGYRIFYSVNSGPFQLLTSLDKNARTYVDTDLTTRELRCYYVQVYDSANTDITASSNTVCDSIKPPSTPKNNYLRTASVILNTSSIQIVGYIDSLSGAEYYEFQRSIDSTGGFSTIYTMNAPLHTDSISYIDNSVNPVIHSYHYHIITLDSCKKIVDSTNLGQTMLLTAVGQPNGTNILTWNDYRNWYDGPDYYSIYRSEDGINYTLLTPTVNYANARQNTYVDNINGITAGQGTFYYYIKAVENNNAALYPFTDTSYSNIAQAYQDPIVYIPDAFCPNGKNRIFIPIGIFIDVQGYDFSILNRWGDLLFESNNPDIGWDGTDKSGKAVRQGVYVYLLTYTSSRGEYFQRKGTVTLLK